MGVSVEERDRRYKAIRELMKKEGLHTLLIAGRGDYISRGNIRYVTDYGIITGEQHCVFPLQGSPIFVARNALVKLRLEEWDLDFKVTSNPIEEVKEMLSHFDSGNGARVGVVGMADISVPMYSALKEHFRERLIDATWIFRQLRLVKSPEEIEKMRISASIADRVFTVVRDMVCPGISDYEIYGEVKKIIHEMGCEYSLELINAEGAKANLFYPTGDRLEANGTLALEITPCYEGYFTQLPITLPVGEYPVHIRRMIAVWKQAVQTATSMLRPGAKVSDVYDALVSLISREGYVSPGRGGHGIGLDVIDFWALNEPSSMILESGMTLVLHPGIFAESGQGGIAMGYTYLITDTASEKLNKVAIGD